MSGLKESEQRDEKLNLDDFFNESTLGLISFLTKRLVGKFDFTTSDVEDLEQELSLQLIQRIPKFDPKKSSKNTFIDRVIRNRINSIIEKQRRQYRMFNKYIHESNDPSIPISRPNDEENNPATLQRLLKASEKDKNLQDLKLDLRIMASKLPPNLREAMERLKKNPKISQVSRDMNVHRSTIYEYRDSIRGLFKEAGFDEYF